MFCVSCGNKLKEASKFCAGCGSPVNTGSMGSEVTSAKHTDEAKDIKAEETAPVQNDAVPADIPVQIPSSPGSSQQAAFAPQQAKKTKKTSSIAVVVAAVILVLVGGACGFFFGDTIAEMLPFFGNERYESEAYGIPARGANITSAPGAQPATQASSVTPPQTQGSARPDVTPAPDNIRVISQFFGDHGASLRSEFESFAESFGEVSSWIAIMGAMPGGAGGEEIHFEFTYRPGVITTEFEETLRNGLPFLAPVFESFSNALYAETGINNLTLRIWFWCNDRTSLAVSETFGYGGSITTAPGVTGGTPPPPGTPTPPTLATPPPVPTPVTLRSGPTDVRVVPNPDITMVPMPFPEGIADNRNAKLDWVRDIIEGFFPDIQWAGWDGRPNLGWTHSSEGLINFFVTLPNDSIWGWGENNRGQLGDGTTENRLVPVMIMDNVFESGAGSGFALRHDGGLWTWGQNIRTTANNRNSPFLVMDNVVSVGSGSASMFALRDDGTLWAWGNNSRGHLGDGTTENRDSPVMILDNVVSITRSDIPHMLVLRTDNSLWGWGQRHDGAQWLDFSSVPVMISRNFVAPSPGTALIGDDGTSFGIWSGFAPRR